MRVTVPHEDAAQVGVALKVDAKEIVALALVPVGGGPQVRHAGGCRRGAGRAKAGDAQGFLGGGVEKVIDDLEARGGFHAVIDRREVHEHGEVGAQLVHGLAQGTHGAVVGRGVFGRAFSEGGGHVKFFLLCAQP